MAGIHFPASLLTAWLCPGVRWVNLCGGWRTQEGFGVQGTESLICSIAVVSDVKLAKLTGHSQHS